MTKKNALIMTAAVAGALAVSAAIPQLKITVGEKTATLYPEEEMSFGATAEVTEGVNQVTVNGNTLELGAIVRAEYCHSDAAPKVNGVALDPVDENIFSGTVALVKGGKVYFDGIGRAGNVLNKNLRNLFTVSEDGEYAVFNGCTDTYNVTVDAENMVGNVWRSSNITDITIDGVAIEQPLKAGYNGRFDGKRISLVKGQTVRFEGVPDLGNALQLHLWDVTSPTEATFKGNDGSYDMIWDKGTALFFTELEGWPEYPAMLYVGGKNWGHPGAGYVTVPGEWKNSEMKGMMNLNNVGGDKWQCAMYLANGFAFKFAKNHWMETANEISGKVGITSATPEILGVDAEWGDFIPGTNFTPGVYMITVDLSAKTIAAEKVTVPEKARPSYSVNGIGMADEGAVYHTIIDNLAEDQIVNFENFDNLARALQPDFWEVIDAGSAKFLGITGRYHIYYDYVRGIAYTYSDDMNFNAGNAAWVAGNCWGHPGAAPQVTSRDWDFGYSTCLQMKKVEEGVYEATLYLPADFCVKFFKARDWEQEASTKVVTPLPENMFAANEYGDLLPGEDFVAGVYTLRVDYIRNIVYAVGYYAPAYYLFAHMSNDNYGKLFYSVSRDGYHWETLNNGNAVVHAYSGHPDIMKGRDAYYMIGVKSSTHVPVLWRSENLTSWESTDLSKEIFNKITSLYGYENEEEWYGAPKLFYDADQDNYIITWHAGNKGAGETREEWASKRTFYIETKDFKTFTDPKFLFSFTGYDENLASIDVIIRKIDGVYYAILKDERWDDEYPETAKTVRIARSKGGALGPYENPGPAITPALREAPTLVMSPDERKFRIYCERYPYEYELYSADSIESTDWNAEPLESPNARHGCVVRVSEAQYRAIISKYNR